MTCCGGDILARKANGELLLVVAAALIDGAGRILLARRPAHKSMGGLWEFPGGKVVGGETPEGALARELEEELGITTYTGCFLPITFASHAYDNFHLLMPLYAVRQWEGVITPAEHDAIAWVDPIELMQYEMPPADVPLVRALQDYLR